jgi:apolipoprotein N-acyltransferase
MIDLKNKFKSPLALSILTGILIGTSTIPFPPWALFFCLSPLVYIWTKESPKKVFWYTTLSFTIASCIGFFWMSFLLHKFALLPWPVSVLVGFLFAGFSHIHISIVGYIFAKWIRKFSMAKTLSACSLIALSWLVFPILFPWNFGLGWLYGGLQGYQFADIIGSEGLSTITILLNGAFLFSFLKIKETKVPLSTTILAIIIFNFAGSLYSKNIPKSERNLNVVIAQANIGNLEDEYKRNPGNYKSDVFLKYSNLTELGLAKSTEKADLIIWPETAFPEYYTRNFFNTMSGKRLRDLILKEKADFITGVFAQSPTGQTANAALILNKEAVASEPPVYKKILLAFGEYLPGEQSFPILRKWFPMVGDFAKGESAQVRVLEKARVGIQICYEGIFPHFSRELAQQGAQVFVNLTNDSWYGPYSEPLQHLYLWAFRAVETRTPMIRSTNTGISTVALPDGSLLEQSPLYEPWSGFFKVPLKTDTNKTVFVRWGHKVPLPFMLIVFIISLIYGKQRS